MWLHAIAKDPRKVHVVNDLAIGSRVSLGVRFSREPHPLYRDENFIIIFSEIPGSDYLQNAGIGGVWSTVADRQ